MMENDSNTAGGFPIYITPQPTPTHQPNPPSKQGRRPRRQRRRARGGAALAHGGPLRRVAGAGLPGRLHAARGRRLGDAGGRRQGARGCAASVLCSQRDLLLKPQRNCLVCHQPTNPNAPPPTHTDRPPPHRPRHPGVPPRHGRLPHQQRLAAGAVAGAQLRRGMGGAGRADACTIEL
jgi:hypothetical protein